MQILSRCLIWGTDLKYAWPLWCMVGICCGFCTKFWPRFSIYGISVICLFSLWALVALSTLRKRIAFALLIIALNIFFIIGRYEAPQPELQSSIWRSLEYAYVSGRGKIVKIYASSWKIRVLLRLENGCLLWGESADKRLLDYQGKQLKFNGLLLPIAENTQGDKKATFCGKIKKEDGKLDFTKDALILHNMTKAFVRYPTAFCYYDNFMIKVFKSEYKKSDNKSDFGKIIEVNNNGIFIQALNGVYIIKELQREGKKRQTVKEFLCGNKLNTGEYFK